MAFKQAVASSAELSFYEGLECSFTDGCEAMPMQTTTLKTDETTQWFKKSYDDEWCLRLLICSSIETLPWSNELISLGNPSQGQDFERLARLENGGSSATVGHPAKFIAQTPKDGGAFCSFSLTTTASRRGLVSGLYQSDHASYDCQKVLDGARLYSGWRTDGWQILVLPVAFLVAHVTHKAKEIEVLSRKVSAFEGIVTHIENLEDPHLDFGSYIRKLHTCSMEVLRLERRAHFEVAIAQGIDQLLDSANAGRSKLGAGELITSPLGIARSLMQAQAYDLTALPKRIESQRILIFNLTIQRDSKLNLQIGRTNMDIANTSRLIAEASMRDAASMKTIAILTMVFLPGTAVASFFSISMFNWSAGPGQSLASPYIWIYFVATVPLTALVIMVWHFTLRKKREKRESRIQSWETKKS